MHDCVLPGDAVSNVAIDERNPAVVTFAVVVIVVVTVGARLRPTATAARA
jgi:hypothetical protein